MEAARTAPLSFLSLGFQAVRLMAELSLEYHVHDPVLWHGLLQKLIYFEMVRGGCLFFPPIPTPTPPPWVKKIQTQAVILQMGRRYRVGSELIWVYF